jgi:hypothetical protein
MYSKKTITEEEFWIYMETYRHELKAGNALLSAYIHAEKSQKLFRTFKNIGLIGENGVIDIGEDFEMEKVRCELEGKKILIRQECLDLSGEKKNYDICKECIHYEITRRLLLPDYGQREPSDSRKSIEHKK